MWESAKINPETHSHLIFVRCTHKSSVFRTGSMPAGRLREPRSLHLCKRPFSSNLSKIPQTTKHRAGSYGILFHTLGKEKRTRNISKDSAISGAYLDFRKISVWSSPYRCSICKILLYHKITFI